MTALTHRPTLARRLEALWQAEPRLRPRPELHDYPLTYPPAVELERPAYAACPTDEQFQAEAIGAHTGAGLYVHFPWCQYRCRYCFHYELSTAKDHEKMARYVRALDQEMARFKALSDGVRVGLYFLGGGTPTQLPPELLDRFLDRLLHHFGPPPTAMSTVEAKPITATEERLRLLTGAGFRRINLGVQTLDPELYSFHHHGESIDVAIAAIHRARDLGFSYVNIDLMTGLQGQSPRSWEITLRRLEQLARSGAIDSVFIYPYHDDPRSKTYGQPNAVPGFVETAHSDALARDLFTRMGWRELGARFYRSPRHVRRELLGLARMRINPAYGQSLYHGLGCSSFSLGDRATYLNHRKPAAYCDAVEEGQLAISHWTTLSPAQQATRDLSFDLLYSPITRVRTRRRKYGQAALRFHDALLDHWVDLGLGERDWLLGTFKLNALGKLVHQQIIPQHYLEQDRDLFDQVMVRRQASGRRYRGY